MHFEGKRGCRCHAAVSFKLKTELRLPWFFRLQLPCIFLFCTCTTTYTQFESLLFSRTLNPSVFCTTTTLCLPTTTLPTSHISQAASLLNTVTIPPGKQMGTDSSLSGEGLGDHTLYGAIYDHANRTVYWRTQNNMNLARLRLADAGLAAGTKTATLSFSANPLPWFADAAAALDRS